MASFIQTGDPNTHKLTPESVVGVPEIDQQASTQLQFLVTKTEMRQGRVDMLRERCDFWLGRAERVPF
jgi:hypothetical protein